jgi:hypothetical protein
MSLQEGLLQESNAGTTKKMFRIDWEDNTNSELMLFKQSKLSFRQKVYNFILKNKWYFYSHLILTMLNVLATLVFAIVHNWQLQSVAKENSEFQAKLHNGFGGVVLVLQIIVWIDNVVKMIVLRSWWCWKDNTLQMRHILDTIIIWAALAVDIVLMIVSNVYITRHFTSGNPDPIPGQCDDLCVGSIVGSGLGCIMVLRLFIYMSWTHEMSIIIRGIRRSVTKVLYMFAIYILFIYLVSIPVFLLENPIYGAKTVNGTVPVDAFLWTQRNHGSLYHSFLTMMQTATTDDWGLKMQGSIDNTILSWAAPLIYIPFLLIAAYLILNIVTGIIIQSVLYQGKQAEENVVKTIAEMEEEEEEEDQIYEDKPTPKRESIVLKDVEYRPPRDTELLSKLLEGMEKMNKELEKVNNRMDHLEEMIQEISDQQITDEK